MPAIAQIIQNRPFRIVAYRPKKHYLKLSIDGVLPPIYIPFNLVPARDLLIIMQELDPSAYSPDSC
jgi:hypothetical protein